MNHLKLSGMIQLVNQRDDAVDPIETIAIFLHQAAHSPKLMSMHPHGAKKSMAFKIYDNLGIEENVMVIHWSYYLEYPYSESIKPWDFGASHRKPRHAHVESCCQDHQGSGGGCGLHLNTSLHHHWIPESFQDGKAKDEDDDDDDDDGWWWWWWNPGGMMNRAKGKPPTMVFQKKGEPFRRKHIKHNWNHWVSTEKYEALSAGGILQTFPKALSSSILCIILFDMVVSEHGVSLTKAQFHARFSRKNYDEALISGISYSQTNLQIVWCCQSIKHNPKVALQRKNLRASKQSPHQCPPQHWGLRWPHTHTKGLLAACWKHLPTSCCWNKCDVVPSKKWHCMVFPSTAFNCH